MRITQQRAQCYVVSVFASSEYMLLIVAHLGPTMFTMIAIAAAGYSSKENTLGMVVPVLAWDDFNCT